MLPRNIAFVDIETTGLSSTHDRIIEIGIIRVEDNSIVQTYHSLINPQTFLPAEIERITGITTKELENAPTFRSIKQDILEILIDTTFVAHNVRFDYGFIKNEFKRENISFSSKQFCTVKLSRLLYPSAPRHNLDAIIQRFNLVCENRHRALDDAKVLFHFYQKLQENFPREHITSAIDICSRKPTIPPNLQGTDLDRLPENAGVYIFYDSNQTPLYIGKSINIRNRVLSHFAADITSQTEMSISQQVKHIETIETAGELGALILESQLIKKMLPIYNKKSRVKKELMCIKTKINDNGYQECYLESVSRIKPEDLSSFMGFFRSRKQAKMYLSELTKKYTLCEKLLGLEKTNGACFAYRLGRCKGACVTKESPLMYNMRFLTAFTATKITPWPFPGAVIIEEQQINEGKQYFIVDQWCLFGTIAVDEQGNKKKMRYKKQFLILIFIR